MAIYRAERAFSLVDVLVSIAVVAVLISLLMPSLASVRSTAKRVVCSSNVRQIGLGIAMYADDYEGMLPPSQFLGAQTQIQHMQILRTAETPARWDGLGYLYRAGYLDTLGVFFCPSHTGDHPFSRYSNWYETDNGQVVCNYHFRGAPNRALGDLPAERALVTDGLRTRADYNHKIGCNILRSDLAVTWFSDRSGELIRTLPATEGEAQSGLHVQRAWEMLDNPSSQDSPR